MSQDAVAQSVAEHLKQKYGEEFTVEASGGGFGTADNTSWKVVFHPSSDPSLRSHATVAKGGGEIRDYYTGDRVARDLAKSLEGQATSLLGGRAFIASGMRYPAGSGGAIVEIGTRGMSIAEFFKENPTASVMLGILAEESAGSEAEIAGLRQVAEIAAASAPQGRVYLAVVDAKTFDDMTQASGPSELQDIEQKSRAWVDIDHSSVGTPTIDPAN